MRLGLVGRSIVHFLDIQQHDANHYSHLGSFVNQRRAWVSYGGFSLNRFLEGLSKSKMSGYQDYTRVSAQTHVNKVGGSKGSQSVLFVRTLYFKLNHRVIEGVGQSLPFLMPPSIG